MWKSLIFAVALVVLFTASLEAGTWRGVISSSMILRETSPCKDGVCPLIQRPILPILPRAEVETIVEKTKAKETFVIKERPRFLRKFLQHFRLFRR